MPIVVLPSQPSTLVLNGTVESTSSSTGTLQIINGGVGITKSVFVNGNSYTTNKIGVGTTNPLAYLNVNATIANIGGYGQVCIDCSNAGGPGGSLVIRNGCNNGGNTTGSFACISFDTDGSTATGTSANTTPSTYNAGNGFIYCLNTGGAANNASKMGFQLWNGGAEVEPFSIYPNLYVGIGLGATTYPSTALHVNGTITAGGYLYTYLSTSTYANGAQDLVWASPLTSSSVSIVTPPGAWIKTNDPGVYLFTVKLNCDTAVSTLYNYTVYLYYSTNSGSSWTLDSATEGNFLTNGTTEFLRIFMSSTTVVNTYWKIVFVNSTGANFLFSNVGAGSMWSRLVVNKVG